MRQTSDGRPVPAGAAGFRFALVVARFNDGITSKLSRGARAALVEAGAAATDIEEFAVPGAYEIPQAARAVAETGRFDAVVALGCVIRGETPHFDYICTAAAHGLMAAAGDTGVPMAFGVLTTDTEAQAAARAGDGPDNKGIEAAAAAIEMARLFRALRADEPPRSLSETTRRGTERGSGAPASDEPGGVQGARSETTRRGAERGSGAPASDELGGVQGARSETTRRGTERGSGAPASDEPGGVQGARSETTRRGAERGSGAPASDEPGGVQGARSETTRRGAERGSGAPASDELGGVQGCPQ